MYRTIRNPRDILLNWFISRIDCEQPHIIRVRYCIPALLHTVVLEEKIFGWPHNLYYCGKTPITKYHSSTIILVGTVEMQKNINVMVCISA